VAARNVPCLAWPSLLHYDPWCLRIDWSPFAQQPPRKSPDPLSNATGSTYLMSGGSMVSKAEADAALPCRHADLSDRIKSVSSRRKRKRSPTPEAEVKSTCKPNFSAMSGGGLVARELPALDEPVECRCDEAGRGRLSSLMFCPLHKAKLPKLSIPTDPKDSSWISDYISALHGGGKNESG
jgi:hypothetical protein